MSCSYHQETYILLASNKLGMLTLFITGLDVLCFICNNKWVLISYFTYLTKAI